MKRDEVRKIGDDFVDLVPREWTHSYRESNQIQTEQDEGMYKRLDPWTQDRH